MKYQVLVLPRAQKSLARMTKPVFKRVRDAIEGLTTDPRPPGCKKLVDRDGWRIRVGDYRVIYKINDLQRLVTVLHVGHRSDIYS